MAEVWVLCATKGQRKQIDVLLASFVASIRWLPQRHSPNTFQARFSLQVDSAWLASELAMTSGAYEIENEGERFLYHQGLGVHRQQLDEAGEVVLRVGQIERLLQESAGSNAEFARLIRVAQGLAWLDLLEPYRVGALRADQLPKAV